MLYGQEEDDEIGGWMVREGETETASKGYRELKIYQQAHALGVGAHRLSLRLPKYELYETGSQLRRASKSVSANLVEGYGRRRYKADYLRFLTYAKASLDETEEHLQYIRDCHPEQSDVNDLLQTVHSLGRKLARFLELVAANHRA